MSSNITVPHDQEAAAALTQLRDLSLKPAQVRKLVSQLTGSLSKHVVKDLEDDEQVAVIVVLRSGLAMADTFLDSFPDEADTVVYHIGLFREKVSLQPVEYYNKLPQKSPRIKRAYVLDPLVATGGTAKAAINILKDWGVQNITLFSLLGSRQGLDAVANFWPEGINIVVGAVDEELDTKGYVKPGLGDIGDRLYGTSLQ